MTTRSRVLIIGLDGASWNVLRPLIEGGQLPHLAALAARGASGAMHSTYPPLTPPAWTSFQTGVTPPRHGVWAFTELTDDGWPSPTIVSSTTIRCKTLWEYLSDHQHRVTLVDVPLTYPFRAISGRLVSDIFIPYNTPGHHTWTQPAELGPEIDRQVGGWQFIKGPEMRGQLDDAGATRFLELMQDFVRQREAAALYLLAQPDWDVAMVHFQAVDVFQHALWGWLLPDHPLFRPERHAQVIAFYKRIDLAIGRMVAVAPPDTLVLVLSDHGFRSHRKILNLNAWLYRRGWLKIPRLQTVRRAVARSAVLTRGARWLKRLHVPKASILLGYRPSFRVDRQRSQAISTAGPWQTQYGLISLKRDGDPGRRARLLQDITKALLELRDPETGERVVADVRTVAELYGGAIGANSPDLVVIPAD
ncbi:MAG: alkaline phosphatase family protein, partial [Caldilineales bacterium]|nr:alkaline phosphatase family protein [Caldilineales bacterium]